MGYSTQRIELDAAKKRAAKMKCTEWSCDLGDDIPTARILKKAIQAEISDHESPRIYFTFADNLFAMFENVKPGEREAVLNY